MQILKITPPYVLNIDLFAPLISQFVERALINEMLQNKIFRKTRRQH